MYMENGHFGVVSGVLERGDGGYNEPWSWSLEPASVIFADVAIEACAVCPSAVETDLDYFLRHGRYCPSAIIVARDR
jgi:hypothetical protein